MLMEQEAPLLFHTVFAGAVILTVAYLLHWRGHSPQKKQRANGPMKIDTVKNEEYLFEVLLSISLFIWADPFYLCCDPTDRESPA